MHEPQELISCRYLSCCCCWGDLFKKPKTLSFQIGFVWNLARSVLLACHCSSFVHLARCFGGRMVFK